MMSCIGKRLKKAKPRKHKMKNKDRFDEYFKNTKKSADDF